MNRERRNKIRAVRAAVQVVLEAVDELHFEEQEYAYTFWGAMRPSAKHAKAEKVVDCLKDTATALEEIDILLEWAAQ